MLSQSLRLRVIIVRSLRMLSNWGAIVSFLFITFGFTAMKVNQLIFMAQLRERDLVKTGG